MLKRKGGVTREEFLKYWYDKHAPLIVKTFPEPCKYIQNHPLDMPWSGEPPFDGISEVWFEDLAAYRKFADAYMGERGKVIHEDEKKFLDTSKMPFFVTEERLIKDAVNTR